MKLIQKFSIITLAMLILTSALVVVTGTQPASAAFYDKEADCGKANGVWAGGKCYLMDKDGKAKCNAANGTWHTVSLANGGAPYVVELTLADPAGYCESPNPDDNTPGPDECKSHLFDALTGECSEEKFCKKYSSDAVKNACIKGYVEGESACDGLSGNKKEACTDGAKNGVHKNDTPPSGNGRGSNKCEANILKSFCSTGVMGLLGLVLDILTAGVGIVAVGGIAYGALLYTTAGGSQEQVKKAIGIIQNVIIGLVAYVSLYAFLQFLLPGGIF